MDFPPLWGSPARPVEIPERGMSLADLDEIAPAAADLIRARLKWPLRHTKPEDDQDQAAPEQAAPTPPRQRRAPRSERATQTPPKQRTAVSAQVKETPARVAKKAAPKKGTEKAPGGTDPFALTPARRTAKATAAKKAADRPKRGK